MVAIRLTQLHPAPPHPMTTIFGVPNSSMLSATSLGRVETAESIMDFILSTSQSPFFAHAQKKAKHSLKRFFLSKKPFKRFFMLA
jgi:hypothetical protein